MTLASSVEKVLDSMDLEEIEADQRTKTRSARKKGLSPALLVIPLAGNTFDAYSTREAMKAGGREGNPALAGIAGNEAALYLTKAGIGIATAAAAEALAKSGHRNLGKVVSILGAAVPVAAGVHNMSRVKK